MQERKKEEKKRRDWISNKNILDALTEFRVSPERTYNQL
jgi:hypothetical protein